MESLMAGIFLVTGTPRKFAGFPSVGLPAMPHGNGGIELGELGEFGRQRGNLSILGNRTESVKFRPVAVELSRPTPLVDPGPMGGLRVGHALRCPEELPRLHSDRRVTRIHRQAEIPPAVIHGRKKFHLPTVVREDLRDAWFLQGLRRLAVFDPRRENNDLGLVFFERHLDLRAGFGFADHTERGVFPSPRIPQLHRALGSKFHDLAGSGIHGQVNLARSDLAVEIADGSAERTHILHKGIADFFEGRLGIVKLVGGRDDLVEKPPKLGIVPASAVAGSGQATQRQDQASTPAEFRRLGDTSPASGTHGGKDQHLVGRAGALNNQSPILHLRAFQRLVIEEFEIDTACDELCRQLECGFRRLVTTHLRLEGGHRIDHGHIADRVALAHQKGKTLEIF